jgi:hypothetical protein
VNVVNGGLKIGEFDPFLKNIKRNINVILKCLRVFLQLNLVVILDSKRMVVMINFSRA